MKLELKHLIYQHFKPLKVLLDNGEQDIIVSIDFCDGIITLMNENSGRLLQYQQFRLVLRPMSDLNYKSQNELVLEFGISIDIAYNIQNLIIDRNNYLKRINLETYEFLLSNHFDCFGLIKENLAVPIHQIKQKNEVL